MRCIFFRKIWCNILERPTMRNNNNNSSRKLMLWRWQCYSVTHECAMRKQYIELINEFAVDLTVWLMVNIGRNGGQISRFWLGFQRKSFHESTFSQKLVENWTNQDWNFQADLKFIDFLVWRSFMFPTRLLLKELFVSKWKKPAQEKNVKQIPLKCSHLAKQKNELVN